MKHRDNSLIRWQMNNSPRWILLFIGCVHCESLRSIRIDRRSSERSGWSIREYQGIVFSYTSASSILTVYYQYTDFSALFSRRFSPIFLVHTSILTHTANILVQTILDEKHVRLKSFFFWPLDDYVAL